MERKSFLGLTAEVYDTLSVKLKFEDVFVVASEFYCLKGVEESVEQKKKLVFWIVRHNDQETNYSVEHIVELFIGFALDFSQFCDACFDEGVCLRDEVVGEGHFA
jgi:hypothetical protein